MTTNFFEANKETLEGAIRASRSREYWSPYPESASPRVYGETAQDEGIAAFKGHLGKAFEIDQPSGGGQIGEESSPFGIPLDTSYPESSADQLIDAAQAAAHDWARADIEARVGVCLEALSRIHGRVFELAFSVMHTTGQAFMMAFQAGGPHALDRGLEATAYAYEEMKRTPGTARWEKPQGKRPPLVLDKTFRVAPRGIGLIVGCSTFPTWNSYPAIFADLATGNCVIVKPHPKAILPLAITVSIIREVLAEAGFDPNVITLGVDTLDAPIGADLATRDEIAIVDFTGGSAFGNWLEENARQAQVYTEKSGVNNIVIDSTDNFKGLLGNLAFTLSLYSGQMCTTTQNIFIPKGGIDTDEGPKSFDEVADALAQSVAGFLADDKRAPEILGAIQSDATMARIEEENAGDNVLLKSRAITHGMFPGARVHTPVLLKLSTSDGEAYSEEKFGPITNLVATDDTADSFKTVRVLHANKGAISFGVYSTSEEILAEAEEVAIDGKVSASFNLTGGVFVNQSAAFSDYHATGGNPAANASLSDAAFVANRFRIVQTRRHADAA